MLTTENARRAFDGKEQRDMGTKAGVVSGLPTESSLVSTEVTLSQKGLFTRITRYEFGRFLVVGAVAALVNLLSAWGYRMLFNRTPFYFEASVALGFSAGTVVSFLLNKIFTFRANAGKTRKQALKFGLISIVSVAISTVVAHLIFMGCMILPKIAGNTHRVESIAHLLTIGVMAVFNYFAIKHVAFAKSEI
jgi:putative flippase GtrA